MNTNENRAYSRVETDAEFAVRVAAADKAGRYVHIGSGLSAMGTEVLDNYGWNTHKMQRRIVWIA